MELTFYEDIVFYRRRAYKTKKQVRASTRFAKNDSGPHKSPPKTPKRKSQEQIEKSTTNKDRVLNEYQIGLPVKLPAHGYADDSCPCSLL